MNYNIKRYVILNLFQDRINYCPRHVILNLFQDRINYCPRHVILSASPAGTPMELSDRMTL